MADGITQLVDGNGRLGDLAIEIDEGLGCLFHSGLRVLYRLFVLRLRLDIRARCTDRL